MAVCAEISMPQFPRRAIQYRGMAPLPGLLTESGREPRRHAKRHEFGGDFLNHGWTRIEPAETGANLEFPSGSEEVVLAAEARSVCREQGSCRAVFGLRAGRFASYSAAVCRSCQLRERRCQSRMNAATYVLGPRANVGRQTSGCGRGSFPETAGFRYHQRCHRSSARIWQHRSPLP